jgi:hypothetical protein
MWAILVPWMFPFKQSFFGLFSLFENSFCGEMCYERASNNVLVVGLDGFREVFMYGSSSNKTISLKWLLAVSFQINGQLSIILCDNDCHSNEMMFNTQLIGEHPLKRKMKRIFALIMKIF